MANEKEDANGIIDAQCNSRENYQATDVLDVNRQSFISSSGFAAPCEESPKRPSLPLLFDHQTPSANDSSESICRVDLPNDMIVSSPMKIEQILSLLMESPEKAAGMAAIDIGMAHADAPVVDEPGLYGNGIDVPRQPISGTIQPLLRRSHSWHSDDGRVLRRQSYSVNADVSEKSLRILRRAKSFGDIRFYQHYQQPTSSSTNGWFPVVSAPNATLDALSDLYETIQADQQASGPPVVNILGYSLPLVSIDGDSSDYVCITDVFQTFFSTRHWDEFKAILEKNGIRSVSVAVSSNDNAFGMPEIVDAVDVKQVETLLLSNQARKDGFVRCIRLSTDCKNASMDASTSSAGVMAESKLIMMPERQVGELSSGIRTRHADQSDIEYVEWDGQTLPSIVLNKVQYVRLVDVQQKYLNPANVDDKPQPSPTTAALAKRLQLLKEVCSRLKIDVSKCRPNEKARMVVYAHSCHSSSLHVIAADAVPRLIDHMRHGKNKSGKRPAAPKGNTAKKSKASTSAGNLRVSTMDDWSSDFSLSASTPSGISPLSRPDSVDSRYSGSSTTSGLFTAPPSPIFESGPNSSGTKRRATMDGHGGTEKKQLRKALFPSRFDDCATSSGDRWQHPMIRNTPTPILRNGHLNGLFNALDDSASPLRINLDESMPDDFGPGIPGTDGMPPQPDISFVISKSDDLTLGRDEDNLTDVLTAKELVTPCKVVVPFAAALPVVVYNRCGTRGPVGKYFDHLFVHRNAVCIWCYGCGEYFSLYNFVHHGHDSAPAIPDPLLFMWVANVRDANLVLWRSLIEKAKSYKLENLVRYDLPKELGRTGPSLESEKRDSQTSASTSGTRRSSNATALSGGPVPPQPPVFRRRQVRGDAFVDVMERFSASGFNAPTAPVMGLHSDEHDSAVDDSYSV